MSLSVRDKFYYEQLRSGKVGRGVDIPGVPHFVLPGASSTHHAFVSDRVKNPFTTVKDALTACVAGRGDAIVLLPGTHTVATASLAMSKADVRIFGPEAWMGLDKPGLVSRAILTTTVTGDEIMNVSAAGCGLVGVTVRPITASDAIDLTSAATHFTLKNCYFDLFTPAASTSTVGVTLAAAVNALIDGCTFLSDGAQGNAIVATGALDSFILNSRFVNNAGTWASAILTGAATAGLEIGWCQFMCYGTAMTVGINGTGATIASGVWVHDCRAGSLVTKLVDNYDAGEAEISECYDSGVGGADGGVLVTAIT